MFRAEMYLAREPVIRLPGLREAEDVSVNEFHPMPHRDRRGLTLHFKIKPCHRRAQRQRIELRQRGRFENLESRQSRRGEMSRREFTGERRAYLLGDEETKTPATKALPQ